MRHTREESLAAVRRSRPLRERRRSRPVVEELESRNLLSVLTPAQVRQAYGFNQLSYTGSGQTIAIVDAYDDPNIASDLHHFDAQFGLPDPSFTKMTPEGQPAVDTGWAGEIALDVEWAHAIAPGANIVLVEAKSASLSDLLGAVQYAATQTGASVVSMSWGASEFAGEAAYDSVFNQPGVTFVASAGDNGAWYGADWPASSPNVLAVGGTTLSVSSTGSYLGETAWTSYSPWQYGGGGGYSSYESEPAYQSGVQSSGARTTPDVAYDASPSTGFYVYDSTNGGWFAVGGTSAGAPQWAALVTLADQGRASLGQAPLTGSSQTLPALYALAQSSYGTYYHDVTRGSNGYSARPGYDLVTGLGSPKANALVPALVKVTGSGATLKLNAQAVTGTTTTTQTTTTKPAQHQDTAATTPAPEGGSSTSGTGTTTQTGSGGTSTTSTRTTAALNGQVFLPPTTAGGAPAGTAAAAQALPAPAPVGGPPASPGASARGAAVDRLSGGGGAAEPVSAEGQDEAPARGEEAPAVPAPDAAAPATAVAWAQARDAYFTGVGVTLLPRDAGPAVPAVEHVGQAAEPLAGVGLALFAGSYWAETAARGEGPAQDESRRRRSVAG
jgi:hypothetical protein